VFPPSAETKDAQVWSFRTSGNVSGEPANDATATHRLSSRGRRRGRFQSNDVPRLARANNNRRLQPAMSRRMRAGCPTEMPNEEVPYDDDCPHAQQTFSERIVTRTDVELAALGPLNSPLICQDLQVVLSASGSEPAGLMIRLFLP